MFRCRDLFGKVMIRRYWEKMMCQNVGSLGGLFMGLKIKHKSRLGETGMRIHNQ